MQIELTHVPLRDVAAEFGLSENEAYARCLSGGLKGSLVREREAWWIGRDVLERARQARAEQRARNIEQMRANLLEQGFTGQQLEAELSSLVAYLDGGPTTVPTARYGGAR